MNWSNIAITGAAGFWSVLAQLPTPGGSEFLAVVGALIVIATAVRLYYDIMAGRRKANESDEPKRRLLPDPLNMRAVPDYVTTTDFKSLDKEIEDKFREIFQQISSEGRRIDSRINDVLKEVSELRGAFSQSQRRNHPNDR
jgi:hypothetical protein